MNLTGRNTNLEIISPDHGGASESLVGSGAHGYTRRECRLPPLWLGVWVVIRRVTLAGSDLCPHADLGGPVGRTGYCGRDGGEEAEGVRSHIKVNWVHGERACHHADALDHQSQ